MTIIKIFRRISDHGLPYTKGKGMPSETGRFVGTLDCWNDAHMENCIGPNSNKHVRTHRLWGGNKDETRRRRSS
jgi:hypothetical protein